MFYELRLSFYRFRAGVWYLSSFPLDFLGQSAKSESNGQLPVVLNEQRGLEICSLVRASQVIHVARWKLGGRWVGPILLCTSHLKCVWFWAEGNRLPTRSPNKGKKSVGPPPQSHKNARQGRSSIFLAEKLISFMVQLHDDGA